jgi:hypothetical protein
MDTILPASDGFGQASASLDNLTSLDRLAPEHQSPVNTLENRGLFGAAFGAIGGAA